MKTTQFEVAGVKFRTADFRKAQVNRGDRLTLKPEPDNKHDPLAIAILKDGIQIGYVPRTHNQQIHEAVTKRPDDVGCCVDAAWASGCWVVVNIREETDGASHVQNMPEGSQDTGQG